MLYKADFPRSKAPINEKLNKELKARYGVRGYPTLIIADASGSQIGQTGYTRAKPADYVKNLTNYSSFFEQKHKLEQAKTEQDRRALYPTVIPLAQRIGKLSLIDKHVRAYDPENKRGYLTGLTTEQAASRYKTDAQGALDMLTKFETKHTLGAGQSTQKFRVAQANCHFRLKNKNQMLAALKKAVEAAPNTPLAQKIERYLANQAR